MLALLAFPLCACATWRPDDVVKPSEVTIPAAFTEIAEGIRAYQDNLRGEIPKPEHQPVGVAPITEKRRSINLGTVACKLTINLELEATAKDSSTGKATLGVANVSKILNASVEGHASAEASAKRGNNISLEFTGIACLPNNVLGTTKPENIGAIARELGAFGNNYQAGAEGRVTPRAR